MLKRTTLIFLAIACVCFAACGAQDGEVVTTAETTAETIAETTTAAKEISVAIDDLMDMMETLEESREFPSEEYIINVTGFSVPVTLSMKADRIAAIEAYGQTVTLATLRDIYGNCSFDLFEYDDAVILECGYYGIGDVYVLTPDGCDEVHEGENASYWLFLEDGKLRYYLYNNNLADITQTGALSAATSYDELLYSKGDASIESGKAIFAEPSESCKLTDKYDFDKEFKEFYKQDYSSIEEVFEANKNK